MDGEVKQAAVEKTTGKLILEGWVDANDYFLGILIDGVFLYVPQ